MKINHITLGVLAALGATLAGCGGGDDPPPLNVLPAGATHHSTTVYGATAVGNGSTAATQDLLTAGLGRTGLGAAAAPAYADPLNPTAAELRRNALFANYRGLADPTANGGYGRLYGPNIDLNGGDTLGEGLIPGKEYLGSLDDGSGRKRVAMAVQIPTSFNPDNPCIVVGPSSGSRGVYGALAAASEWGLKRGCAVALTDAGKGMGLYDPTDDTVNKIDGTRATRSAAGALAHFAANLSDAARNAFNAAFPNRLALKQVHSQINPEKDWGTDTLAAAKYALYALNQEYAASYGDAKTIRFTPANTTVIAGAVSNGGAAALRAAEQDTEGLIDGVVVSEPSAQPSANSGITVNVGGTPVPTVGKPLIDYFTVANLYQPCAALADSVVMAEASIYNYMTLTAMNARAANRCAGLAAKGLVSGATTAAQAADALAKLRQYGWEPQHDTMHNAHYGLGNAAIIGMMYTTGYGRFSVTDNLCGMSLAQVNATGDVIPVSAAVKAASFAIGNGTANGAPASVVYNDSVGGAKSWAFAVSPSTGSADFALDAALCQRALVTGRDTVTGAALTATSTPTLAQSQAVQAGVAEVRLSGNLRGKPTLIVTGRSDALVAINHSSRAYAAFSKGVEGAASQLSYIEVTNAQHFDAFLPLSGFDTRFVPLHAYFNQAMNAMWAKLKSGTALPPSQVVRTTPRGGTPGAAPAITAANVPAIAATPAAGNAITFSGSTINLPN
ncbi:3-hydroxybutyrate oligomer hydrolase family protein [Aquabacterium humicola]|uniref:3-hydroxybutyrate oligomer hydrolase family protein n=1 Tax=Aquabacterium humicola TaxID=3237377 RepID=UPI002543AE19|nr:3-hydroxybutyrate oligomer hydrolase family protein [Rubrivivax pictus]